ncbi:MAG: hypothetical protein ACREQ5_31630, partial [Candidatus Dormibacteria bacterium]
IETDVSSPAMLVTCDTAVGNTEGARRAARMTVARAEAILAHDRSNGMAMGYGAGSLAVLGEADRCRDWIRRGHRHPRLGMEDVPRGQGHRERRANHVACGAG